MNTLCHVNQSRREKVRGLSLIEMMIALVLGLVIVAALTELFLSISRTNQEMAKTNSQIENARYALQFLQDDIVHAGYWGGYVPEFDNLSFDDPPTDAPTAKPLPCTDFSSWNQNFINQLIGIPIEVFQDVPSGCGAILPQKLADTDVLVVRHADTCAADNPGCDSLAPGSLYMQVANCADDIDAGNDYSLDPNDYTLRELNCLTSNLAARRKFVQNIYYIRDYAYEASDGIPTLMRSEFDVVTRSQLPAIELVEGIERFRVEVGIDRKSYSDEDISLTDAILWDDDDERVFPRNRGDGVAEGQFERCLSDVAGCDVDELVNVVAVKIYVLARANQPTTGYTDSKDYVLGTLPIDADDLDDEYKRHVFGATVRLNNISGRREAPYDPNGPFDPNEV